MVLPASSNTLAAGSTLGAVALSQASLSLGQPGSCLLR